MGGMMEGIDDSFDAALFIGYHSRMNSSGVLSHTYHGAVVSDITINREAFRRVLYQRLCGRLVGVPVVLVSETMCWRKEFTPINGTWPW